MGGMGLIRELGGALAHARCTVAMHSLKHKKVMALLAFISIRVTAPERCVLLNVQSLSFPMQIGSKKTKIKVLQIHKAHIKTTACVFMCISESTLSVSHSHSRILRDEMRYWEVVVSL